MNITFVENAKHDIDGEQRGQDQYRLVFNRCLERAGGALKTTGDRAWNADARHGVVDCLRGVAQRYAKRKVKRDRRCHKLPLVIDLKCSIGRLVVNKS